MKSRYFLLACFIAGFAFLAACGGGSSPGTTNVPEITTISELPRATSPMASSSEGDVAADAAKDAQKAATTGLNIVSTTAANFDATDSLGACNMFNQVKEGIASAAQADMILCYVQYMNDQATFSGLTDASGNPIDIYDGAYHIFNLNISNDPGAPNRVKMKIVKNSAGSITNFEMFMCKLGDDGVTLSQNEYTSQIIDGTTFVMDAVGSHQDAGGSGSHLVDVDGVLNVSGHFTSKTVVTKNKGTWGGGLNWSHGTLTQGPGTFTFSGYHYGNYVDQPSGNAGTNSDSTFGLGQMIGDTGALSALAMGDGAVQYSQSGTYDGHTYGPFTGTESWDGDTAAAVASNDYTSAASAGELPTVVTSEIDIGLTAAQTWDCTDDVGSGIVTLPAADATAMSAACSAYTFSHEWIQCWEIIPQNP